MEVTESFAHKASAAFWLAAVTLMSTRMPAYRRCRLASQISPPRRALLMLVNLTMVTLALDTPGAAAIAALKVACLPSSNSASVKDREKEEEKKKGKGEKGRSSAPEYPALHVHRVKA